MHREYLKRDDQYLAIRTQQEENREKMARDHIDRDKAMSGVDGMEVDEPGGPGSSEAHGSKIIVIHPGSQNLRVGLANDALPKTVPMVIARRWNENESEEYGNEPEPKRQKTEHGDWAETEQLFGDEVSRSRNLQLHYTDQLCSSRNNTKACRLS